MCQHSLNSHNLAADGSMTAADAAHTLSLELPEMTFTYFPAFLVCLLLQTAAARSLLHLSTDEVDTHGWALPAHSRHLVLDGSKLNHGDHGECWLSSFWRQFLPTLARTCITAVDAALKVLICVDYKKLRCRREATKFENMCLLVSSQYTSVTDRRTNTARQGRACRLTACTLQGHASTRLQGLQPSTGVSLKCGLWIIQLHWP